MFTEEQLESVQSPQLEEWLQQNKDRIDETINELYLDKLNGYFEDAELTLIRLLTKCWEDKKCPYA